MVDGWLVVTVVDEATVVDVVTVEPAVTVLQAVSAASAMATKLRKVRVDREALTS